MYSLSGVSWGAFKDAEQNRDGYVAQCVVCVVCVSVCVCVCACAIPDVLKVGII